MGVKLFAWLGGFALFLGVGSGNVAAQTGPKDTTAFASFGRRNTDLFAEEMDARNPEPIVPHADDAGVIATMDEMQFQPPTENVARSAMPMSVAVMPPSSRMRPRSRSSAASANGMALPSRSARWLGDW